MPQLNLWLVISDKKVQLFTLMFIFLLPENETILYLFIIRILIALKNSDSLVEKVLLSSSVISKKKLYHFTKSEHILIDCQEVKKMNVHNIASVGSYQGRVAQQRI